MENYMIKKRVIDGMIRFGRAEIAGMFQKILNDDTAVDTGVYKPQYAMIRSNGRDRIYDYDCAIEKLEEHLGIGIERMFTDDGGLTACIVLKTV